MTPLGQTPEASDERDAVHVAIVPVLAGERLLPGQRVGLLNPGTVCRQEPHIGIVDPFAGLVEEGQRVWLLLFPNSIRGMRHHWEHPAFPDDRTIKASEAETWLKIYAARYNEHENPQDAFVNLIRGLRCGYVFFNGSDLHGYQDLPEAKEFQKYAEAYLGHRIDLGGFEFSCSC